jgi:hypothetical protein
MLWLVSGVYMPDKKRLNQLHSVMLNWGQWLSDGRSVQGLYNTSVWPTGRPVEARQSVKHKKPMLPYCQPHSTRVAAPRQPVMVEFEIELERIHPVILQLDDTIKHIVICLYIRGMCFADITRAFNLPSREIGDSKYKALKAVSTVVR